MSTELAKIDTSAEDVEALSLLEGAKAFSIQTRDDLEVAASMKSAAKQLRIAIEEHYFPAVESAHKTHKLLLEARNKHTQPLAEAEKILSEKGGTWVRAENARVEKAQREAIAQQRKAQEEAMAARANAAAQNRPAPPLPPKNLTYVPPAAPVKVEGATFRETWSAEVVDKEAFIAWVVQANQFALVEVNMAAVNAMARSQKGALSVPGIKAVSSTSMGSR